MAPFIALAHQIQAEEAQSSLFAGDADKAGKLQKDAYEQLANFPGLKFTGSEKIGMLCYDGMTMIDLIGPQYFFASMAGAQVCLISPTQQLAPIMGDTGFAIVPPHTLSTCPSDLDLFFVPGGTTGTLNAMKDDKLIEFVADHGSRAKYVTSVCTGSLILGQAGLLKGKKATSHWAVRNLLSNFKALPTEARVVQDGNVITGAGVSAGLDFALAVLALFRGQAYASAIQLQSEYDPMPPFEGGSFEKTNPELAAAMRDRLAPFVFEASKFRHSA
jgi:putative intracellular protease/amidase